MTETSDYVFEDVDEQGRPVIIRYTVHDHIKPTTIEQIEAAAIHVAWEQPVEYDRSAEQG